MAKVSKDFFLQEFLPPEIFEMSPVAGIWFLDPRIIIIAQTIRDRFGKPVTINNWADGGAYKNSGFRDPLSDIGAMFSQHKFGRAIDIKIEGMESEEIRKDILKNYYTVFRPLGLSTMEADTPTWVHVDCRHTNQDSLFIVKPK